MWVSSYNFTIDALGSIGPVYNPFQHFDNGYIREGWNFVQNQVRIRSLTAFVRAGHAIADFYAHSTYGEFAGVADNQLRLWDGTINHESPLFTRPPDYSQAPFGAAKGSLTTNPGLTNQMSREEVTQALNEHVILSGRFAQRGDKHAPLEEVVTYPRALYEKPDYAWRGCLPHHNEIAVDDERTADTHRLYNAEQYTSQFTLRKNSAIEHMAQIYKQMGKPGLFKAHR